jgi:hypothetical protein
VNHQNGGSRLNLMAQSVLATSAQEKGREAGQHLTA